MPLVVYNGTQFPIHVALKQVGVLHYHNNLRPGERVEFRCGRVWFTVSVRKTTDDDANEFRTRDIVVPIIGATLTAASIATLPLAFIEIPVLAASAGGLRVAQGMRYAFGAFFTGATFANAITYEREEENCSRHGVYANGKTVYVVGGKERAMEILYGNELPDIVFDSFVTQCTQSGDNEKDD